MKKNEYRGNETGMIKGSDLPKKQPTAKATVGRDLRGTMKGGKK